MTAVAVAGTRRDAILAHLADHPDLTASELARVIGSGSHLGNLLRDMQAKAQLVSRPGLRPGQGGRVYLWRVAPSGTVAPPRPPVPAEVLARKRERDRRATAARRARARPLFAGAASLPDAACIGADPALFFPKPGDVETEVRAVAICSACPARAACYARAVRNKECSGVWGGVNFELVPRPWLAVIGERHQERRPAPTMTDHVNPQPPEPAAVASRAEAALIRDTPPLWGPPEPELETEDGL